MLRRLSPLAAAMLLAACSGTTSATTGGHHPSSSSSGSGSSFGGHLAGGTTNGTSTTGNSTTGTSNSTSGTTGPSTTTGTTATTSTTGTSATTATTGTTSTTSATTGTTSTTGATSTTGTTSTTSGGPPGAPCASDAECAGGGCTLATWPDAGPSGWTSGYCSPGCTADPSVCGAGTCVDYGGGSYCSSACSAPGTGQDSCRTDYSCFFYGLADGGTSTDGICAPACSAPGAGCIGGSCDAQGYCESWSLDAGVAGSGCAADPECGPSSAGFCRGSAFDDGGAGFWPGGYCSASCTGEPTGFCGSGGTCVDYGSGSSYCEGACVAPGTQSSCRSSYDCYFYYYADGGLSSATDGICAPNCTNAGWDCSSGYHCDNSSGFCSSDPLVSGEAGRTCAVDGDCGPAGGAYCIVSPSWSGGYCTASCTGQPVTTSFCGGGYCNYYGVDGICEESCTTPDSASSSNHGGCRTGYTCFGAFTAAGTEDTSHGVCEPDCTVTGCSNSSYPYCRADGYCWNQP